MSEKILIEGWLEKKSPKKITKERKDIFHNNLPSMWQKRYFVLVRVGTKKAELRYFGTMTPSTYGGNVYGSRKGLIPINSTTGRCSVRREGRTPRRFTVVAPRVSGTHHGIGHDSTLAATSLHQYALRSQESSDARRWYVALHLFLKGDDNAGMSDSEDDDDEPMAAPARSNRADSEAHRRAALRRRRLAQRKAQKEVQAPPPVVQYKPRPKPAPVQFKQPVVRAAPKPRMTTNVPRSPGRYKRGDGSLARGKPPPGIRRASKIERDRAITEAPIEHMAQQTKLQSKPPAGVRRASAVGKSMFQDAMLATGIPTAGPHAVAAVPASRNLHRTVSAIHQDLAGGPVNQVYHSHQLGGQQLDAPPPGVRTASMLDLGVTAPSDRNPRNRTLSTIHREIEDFDIPPPPSYEPSYETYESSSSQARSERGMGDRKFSLIGDILNGKSRAADVIGSSSSSSSSPPRPSAKVNMIRSTLNRSPSRRTNRSRTYSSSLESVGETADSKPGLLQSAARLFESNKIDHVNYIKVRDAIVRNDETIVSAFQNYLASQ